MTKGATRTQRKKTKVACEDCFFGAQLLCALSQKSPCATFRPDRPEGLRPPRQMRFLFDEERRAQSVFAFAPAEQQAELHQFAGA